MAKCSACDGKAHRRCPKCNGIGRMEAGAIPRESGSVQELPRLWGS